ncbi:MAG: NADPH-dependent FMN reductase [Actinomycetes bacterium]
MSSDREPLRILVFSASLRAESLNTRLARIVVAAVERHGASVDEGSMREFEAPSYDGDVETADGLPAGARELRDRLEASDAFVIVSPEYNGSMPGVLKNSIDWVSRVRPQPFNAKHALLLSASPSMVGGNRSLLALRTPLAHLGVRVYPDMFSLAQAHKAFTDDGALLDDRRQARLDDTVAGFLDLVEASVHYPCVRRAWVEFLGELPDPAVDRVDT